MCETKGRCEKGMKKEKDEGPKKQRWGKHWGNGKACSKKNGNSEKDSNGAARRPNVCSNVCSNIVPKNIAYSKAYA